MNNDSIFEIQVGNHDIEFMFSIIQQKQLAKTYFVRGFCVLLFAIGTVMVAQAFVPRKTWVAKEVGETKSGMESKSEYKQGIAIDGETNWYSVKVVYRFSNPEKIDLIGECERDRDDLDGQPLPTEGTVVLVLYLDDNTYALL